MAGKTTLLLTLLCLCLGCTSEQWVKEYVQGQTSRLQENLKSHTDEAEKRQEELTKVQIALERQAKELQASLEAMDKRLTELQDAVVKPSLGIAEEEIPRLRSEVYRHHTELEEMGKNITRLRESLQLESASRDKELEALGARVNDANKFVDMNVTEILKAQNALKDFIIEEVRVLRLERQEHAKELEAIKSRLQDLENTIVKKEPEVQVEASAK